LAGYDVTLLARTGARSRMITMSIELAHVQEGTVLSARTQQIRSGHAERRRRLNVLICGHFRVLLIQCATAFLSGG
jgi:hypothetical protein